MYSVRRMSAIGATNSNLSTGIKVDTKSSVGEGNRSWDASSITPAPVPIPLSAAPNTPLSGMTVGVTDANEPHRDLVLNLYIVRHAETDLNARRPRVVQGQLDTPLNSQGIKQALMLAHRLSKVKVDYIYCSDLLRARQTAEEIARVHCKTVLIDPRLREQNLGDLIGQPWSGAKARLKQVDKNFEEYLLLNHGETSEMVKERVVQSYIDVVEKHLLEPNRISLPRTCSDNFLSEQYGPATPVSGCFAPGNSPASPTVKGEYTSLNVKNRLPPRVSTVVLVTHGGPIRQLLQHLVVDLGFMYHPKVLSGHGKRRGQGKQQYQLPVEPRLTQFPHTAGLFHVSLTRRFSRESEEYDWCGHVVRFNDTAHLAKFSSWHMNSIDVSSSSQDSQPKSHSLSVISNPTTTKGPYYLTRASKKFKDGSNGKLTALNMGSPSLRVKNMGIRMFGKFIGGGIIAGLDHIDSTAPKAEEKRKKSLGW